jgi:hypothetical protein
MVPTRSVAVPTQAGKQVQFRNGMASINDTRDLPYLFARDDVKVMVTDYAMGWMDDVLAHTRAIKADVRWPTGYEVQHTSETEYAVNKVEPPPPVHVSLPGDPLEAVLKEKPRWRKPPSNSSAS